jgi:hypothetical protein
MVGHGSHTPPNRWHIPKPYSCSRGICAARHNAIRRWYSCPWGLQLTMEGDVRHVIAITRSGIDQPDRRSRFLGGEPHTSANAGVTDRGLLYSIAT